MANHVYSTGEELDLWFQTPWARPVSRNLPSSELGFGDGEGSSDQTDDPFRT